MYHVNILLKSFFAAVLLILSLQTLIIKKREHRFYLNVLNMLKKNMA